MTGRPLHALLLPLAGAGRLLEALAAALDGTGPAILPLDPRLPPARVAALIAAFSPTTIETADGTERLRAAGVPEDTAVVIATSGTTGEPKGVLLSAAALLHSARASLDRLGAAPGGRWLCPLPTSHIAGLGVLVRSLVAGSTPVVVARLDPAEADLSRYGCAHVSLVPTQLRRLLAVGAEVGAFGTVLVGGAAVPGGLVAAARAAGARVVVSYGMSETCGGCVYDGVPLAGVSVRVGDGGLAEIAGPVLFSGYRGGAGLEGGWFRTSDLGTVDAGGRLTVLGRADEMINTGGEKVAPAEVAAALEDCFGVREAVVFGEPDEEWGERVTAVVVPEDPSAPPALAALRAGVRRHLPAHAAPRALVLVRELPLLPSGKPNVTKLRTLRDATPPEAAE